MILSVAAPDVGLSISQLFDGPLSFSRPAIVNRFYPLLRTHQFVTGRSIVDRFRPRRS